MALSTSATASATALVTVELPDAFDPGWNRIDGITVDGPAITINPQAYFFRYENPTWLLCDWEQVRDELLPAAETEQTAVEQLALDWITAHGRRTGDPAQVLAVGYEVAAFLYREEYLNEPGLSHVTAQHLKALREATTIMALNKVELDGHISNVGPCWFFPVATSVVFGFPDAEARELDELYHGGWFNEYRRRESVLAHAALGGRLVHGCQATPDMRGGCVLAYGTSLNGFRAELDSTLGDAWMARVAAMARS